MVSYVLAIVAAAQAPAVAGQTPPASVPIAQPAAPAGIKRSQPKQCSSVEPELGSHIVGITENCPTQEEADAAALRAAHRAQQSLQYSGVPTETGARGPH